MLFPSPPSPSLRRDTASFLLAPVRFLVCRCRLPLDTAWRVSFFLHFALRQLAGIAASPDHVDHAENIEISAKSQLMAANLRCHLEMSHALAALRFSFLLFRESSSKAVRVGSFAMYATTTANSFRSLGFSLFLFCFVVPVRESVVILFCGSLLGGLSTHFSSWKYVTARTSCEFMGGI